jgi:hypothetical protein
MIGPGGLLLVVPQIFAVLVSVLLVGVFKCECYCFTHYGSWVHFKHAARPLAVACRLQLYEVQPPSAYIFTNIEWSPQGLVKESSGSDFSTSMIRPNNAI